MNNCVPVYKLESCIPRTFAFVPPLDFFSDILDLIHDPHCRIRVCSLPFSRTQESHFFPWITEHQDSTP